jgi:hypothetical protein
MSKKTHFVYPPKIDGDKLILLGLTVIFIVMLFSLIFQTSDTQSISTVKATSHSIAAGDLSVVGKPSLPAATVDAIFKSLGSPLKGMGKVVEQASQQTNIDDAFALGVWWAETNDGAAGVGLADRNPGSVRGSVGYPSAYDGYTIYPSYSAAIVYWFHMLKNLYINRGLSTVYFISHPYVGTSSSPLWAGKVVALMVKYRGEAPPAPIVVPHGKKVIEPAVYIHITPTPVKQKAQSQTSNTLVQRSSHVVRQKNDALLAASPSIINSIVFFALLLALTIVVWVLWLEKRSDPNLQNGYAPNTDAPFIDTPGIEAGAPETDALVGPITHIDVRKTDIPEVSTPAIRTSQDIVSVPLDAAFVLQADVHSRFRRTRLLPSITEPETAKTGELSADSSLSGRSTGLLRRYGESNLQ